MVTGDDASVERTVGHYQRFLLSGCVVFCIAVVAGGCAQGVVVPALLLGAVWSVFIWVAAGSTDRLVVGYAIQGSDAQLFVGGLRWALMLGEATPLHVTPDAVRAVRLIRPVPYTVFRVHVAGQELMMPLWSEHAKRLERWLGESR